MKFILRVLGLLMLAGGLLFVGCLAENDEAAEVEELDVSEETFTMTMVELDQGGKVVWQKSITKSEQEAKRLRHEQLVRDGLGSSSDAITKDDDCWHPSIVLRLWDQTGQTGNEICFGGTGIADLADYCRILTLGGCVDFWDDEVMSFSTGSSTLVMSDHFAGCCNASCSQRSSGITADATTCEQTSRYVLRGQGCINDPDC